MLTLNTSGVLLLSLQAELAPGARESPQATSGRYLQLESSCLPATGMVNAWRYGNHDSSATPPGLSFTPKEMQT